MSIPPLLPQPSHFEENPPHHYTPIQQHPNMMIMPPLPLTPIRDPFLKVIPHYTRVSPINLNDSSVRNPPHAHSRSKFHESRDPPSNMDNSQMMSAQSVQVMTSSHVYTRLGPPLRTFGRIAMCRADDM